MNSTDQAILCYCCTLREVIQYNTQYTTLKSLLDHVSLPPAKLARFKEAEKLDWQQLTYKTCLDTDWPEEFGQVKPEPTLIFYRGDWELLKKRKKIGIIGARSPSSYGLKMLKELTNTIWDSEVPVVSGLAYGIDAEGHRLALSNKAPAIAIIGGGISSEMMYPSEHWSLLNAIVEAGGLILSEYSPNTQAEVYNFPQRNRLIATLSNVLLVVQAGHKSGTLITAELALELGKDVATIPAQLDNKYFAGNIALLKNGAHLVDSAETLSALLGLRSSKIHKIVHNHPITILLSTAPQTAEQLSMSLSSSITDVLVQLTTLEIAGTIKRNGEFWSLV
jgi:DNA processing protein